MKIAHCLLQGRSGHDAGLSLLTALYREETGKELPEICRTPRGKPYFPEDPVHFSITHTNNHAFCVLSPTPIGIDAEELTRIINPRLAEKILSPQEMEAYLAADDKNRALLTFWVLKEASAKCSGEGINGYPNHTNFSLKDPRVQERDGCLLAIITKESLHAV